MAISIEFIELRNEPRVFVEATAVRIDHCGARSAAAEMNGFLVDHAPGGAGLLLAHPLSPGRTLRLLVFGEAYAREARVRWVRRMQSRYRVGVAFV